MADAFNELGTASDDQGETYLAIRAGTTVRQLQQQLTIELGDLVTQQDAQRLADQVFGSANDCACAVIVDIAPLYEEVLIRAQVALFSNEAVQTRMSEVSQSLTEAVADNSSLKQSRYLASYERYQQSLDQTIRQQANLLPTILKEQQAEARLFSNDTAAAYGDLALGVSRSYLGGSRADLVDAGLTLSQEQLVTLDRINRSLAEDVYASTGLESVSVNADRVTEVRTRIAQIKPQAPDDDFVYDEELAEFGIDEATARKWAKDGIKAVKLTKNIVEVTGAGSFKAFLTKTAGNILTLGLGFLDTSIASNTANLQTRLNIDKFFSETGDIDARVELQNLLSNGRYTEVVIKLSEYGYQYQNLLDMAGELIP